MWGLWLRVAYLGTMGQSHPGKNGGIGNVTRLCRGTSQNVQSTPRQQGLPTLGRMCPRQGCCCCEGRLQRLT